MGTPLHGALGHYRTSIRIVSTTAQAANSRLFEIRNAHASNLLIPTRLRLRALQTAAGTGQEQSLDVFKLTSFSVVDTTNTVTPTSSVKRTTGMAAYPGSAQIRHLTVAGAAAGMTGGTMTKDAQPFASLLYNVVTAAQPTPFDLDCLDDRDSEHPMLFGPNEGWLVESRVVNATSFGVTWQIDCSWAEVGAHYTHHQGY